MNTTVPVQQNEATLTMLGHEHMKSTVRQTKTSQADLPLTY
jgi:hypothetical protein